MIWFKDFNLKRGIFLECFNSEVNHVSGKCYQIHDLDFQIGLKFSHSCFVMFFLLSDIIFE